MRCKACEGSGLLMDDEEWHYTCTICNGDGFVSRYEEKEMRETDPNNRIID
ncbi:MULTISPECIES: hypothetical protein [Gracilibacillus]|uniref:hypothetical protein n=1 Tax=Gracilibacillus TaxID=74385 RepID=UPI0015E85C5B|nr:hypothetical protein [Gracilibacillus dipsosauri]